MKRTTFVLVSLCVFATSFTNAISPPMGNGTGNQEPLSLGISSAAYQQPQAMTFEGQNLTNSSASNVETRDITKASAANTTTMSLGNAIDSHDESLNGTAALSNTAGEPKHNVTVESMQNDNNNNNNFSHPGNVSANQEPTSALGNSTTDIDKSTKAVDGPEMQPSEPQILEEDTQRSNEDDIDDADIYEDDDHIADVNDEQDFLDTDLTDDRIAYIAGWRHVVERSGLLEENEDYQAIMEELLRRIIAFVKSTPVPQFDVDDWPIDDI